MYVYIEISFKRMGMGMRLDAVPEERNTKKLMSLKHHMRRNLKPSRSAHMNKYSKHEPYGEGIRTIKETKETTDACNTNGTGRSSIDVMNRVNLTEDGVSGVTSFQESPIKFNVDLVMKEPSR